MKTLKIRFLDFWPGFDPENNPFMEVLRAHFQVDRTGEPQFIVYSTYGYSHLDYDVPRVFYTAENVRPDFNICDYALGYDRMSFGDRYRRFPLYLFERQKDLHEISARKFEPGPRKFCSFVYSNPDADPARDIFFHLLSRYKPVDSAGRHLNNTGYKVMDKVSFQRNYKFSIAFENSSTPGYSTEKILDAYCAGTIPIYWGDPDIAQDFDSASFINCHEYKSFEEVMERVVALDTVDSEYARVYEAPFFRRRISGYTFEPGFEEFFVHIFQQDREAAFRRNRQFWGKAYETQRRKFASYIARLERRPLFNLMEHIRMIGIPATVRKLAQKLDAKKRERKEARLRDA